MLHAIIVDDEQFGLRSLELLLRDFGDKVKVVGASTDPEQAIGLINDFRPDLVFLDIQMPKLDGFELLEKLSFRKFKLIFTTAHKEHGVRASKKGAIDYLLKPISHDDLSSALDKVNRQTEE